jgi:tetratricopeptide (TPR) repeat protein
MFKKLLDKLTGSSAKEPVAPPEEMITAHDEQGREIHIARSEWREKMLRPKLDAAWNAPDELYGVILGALHDGFPEEVAAASEHLLAIDPIAERGHVIRAIVLMEMESFDAAKQVLLAATAKVGETASILTNLAKVEEAQGANPGATLWRAITLDPNFENALGWWSALERERGGEAAYVAALEKAAALPGSWRAALWLGGHALEGGDIDGALARFRAVLADENVDGEALALISGELGNAGRIEELAGLVGPTYDPARHAPAAGLNLVRALLHLGRLDEAEALLGRLHGRLDPQFTPHLDAMARELQDRRG